MNDHGSQHGGEQEEIVEDYHAQRMKMKAKLKAIKEKKQHHGEGDQHGPVPRGANGSPPPGPTSSPHSGQAGPGSTAPKTAVPVSAAPGPAASLKPVPGPAPGHGAGAGAGAGPGPGLALAPGPAPSLKPSMHHQKSTEHKSVEVPGKKHEVVVGRYQLLDVLGKGGFGTVYRGIDTTTGHMVALKRINLTGVSPKDQRSLFVEIQLLKQLSHPNIVHYIDTVQTPSHLHIVLEFVESGALCTLLNKFETSPPESLLAMYMLQTLRGLQYLHEQGVVHRDIKGANILATKDGSVKLADFGVATSLTENSKFHTMVGTPYWMAPELIELRAEGTACDIWSVGATVLELYTGEPPFFGINPMAAMYHIVQDDHPPLPPGISPELRDFLGECFQKDPNIRISAAGLIRHPWLRAALEAEQREFEVQTRIRATSGSRLVVPTAAMTSTSSIPPSLSPAPAAVSTAASTAASSTAAVASNSTTTSTSTSTSTSAGAAAGGKATTTDMNKPHGPFSDMDIDSDDQIVEVTSGSVVTKLKINKKLITRTRKMKPRSSMLSEGGVLDMDLAMTHDVHKKVISRYQESLSDEAYEEFDAANLGKKRIPKRESELEEVDEMEEEVDPFADMDFGNEANVTSLHVDEELQASMQSFAKILENLTPHTTSQQVQSTCAELSKVLQGQNPESQLSMLKIALLPLVEVLEGHTHHAVEPIFALINSALESTGIRPQPPALSPLSGTVSFHTGLNLWKHKEEAVMDTSTENAPLRATLDEVVSKLVLMGIIPYAVKFTEPGYPVSVVREATRLCQQLCTHQTAQFIGAGGFRALVSLVKRDPPKAREKEEGAWQVLETAIDCLNFIFHVPSHPKNDFCRILCTLGLLPPLVRLLTALSREQAGYMEKVANLIELFARADGTVKAHFAAKGVVSSLVQSVHFLPHTILKVIVKALSNLFADSSTLTLLESVGSLPSSSLAVAVSLLLLPEHNDNKPCQTVPGVHVDSEIKIQTLKWVYYISKVHLMQPPQVADIFPRLREIISSNHNLKEWAFPILWKIATSSKENREQLFLQGGVPFMVGLLTNSSTSDYALDALAIWLQDFPIRKPAPPALATGTQPTAATSTITATSPAQLATLTVEEVLSSELGVSSLQSLFAQSNSTLQFEKIINSLYRMLSGSWLICHTLALSAPFFDQIRNRLAKRLTTNNIRISLLKIISLLLDRAPDPREFIGRHGLINELNSLSNSKSSVIVKNLVDGLLETCHLIERGGAEAFAEHRRLTRHQNLLQRTITQVKLEGYEDDDEKDPNSNEGQNNATDSIAAPSSNASDHPNTIGVGANGTTTTTTTATNTAALTTATVTTTTTSTATLPTVTTTTSTETSTTTSTSTATSTGTSPGSAGTKRPTTTAAISIAAINNGGGIKVSLIDSDSDDDDIPADKIHTGDVLSKFSGIRDDTKRDSHLAVDPLVVLNEDEDLTFVARSYPVPPRAMRGSFYAPSALDSSTVLVPRTDKDLPAHKPHQTVHVQPHGHHHPHSHSNSLFDHTGIHTLPPGFEMPTSPRAGGAGAGAVPASLVSTSALASAGAAAAAPAAPRTTAAQGGHHHVSHSTVSNSSGIHSRGGSGLHSEDSSPNHTPHHIVPVVNVHYTLEQLRRPSINHSVDVRLKEFYLSDTDFEHLFGTSKQGWLSIPQWKRAMRKKQEGLF